jgi:uncharacterized lipoprotein YddW (UPF0748 family)
MHRILIFLTILFFARPDFFAAEKNSAEIFPPAPAREFRAAWIATVGNSCWPSKPGLSTAQQKAELIALLDRAAALKLNSVIFQVRPACDAFYQSSLEPWSEYLTGVQGRAPSPFYDPLAFAIVEAHKRGLELHAWFNPFRAHHFKSVSPIAPNHISKIHPEYVRSYGRYLWLDPGDPQVRDYVLHVVMDVVRRYDVDGVHFDDYFYDYKEKNSAGSELDFPDDATWKKFGINSGLTREDWRRQNINLFIQKIYHEIKALKPWVKFGISPFGIWRPKNPPEVSGFDAYAEIYADSRLWLREGWCDYFSPQLYWPTFSRGQNFAALLNWWENENVHHRNIWPGINSLKVGEWPASEIVNEINDVRHFPNPGEIHWSISALMKSYALDSALAQTYRVPALVPTCPWLGETPPAKPKLFVEAEKNFTKIRWENSGAVSAREWVLQIYTNQIWTTEILPPAQNNRVLEISNADAIAIRAVDRLGNLSAPEIWTPRKYLPNEIPKGATKMKN